jgi:uncharacterized SAM-binding protein YcdF (DUF218 family)
MTEVFICCANIVLMMFVARIVLYVLLPPASLMIMVLAGAVLIKTKYQRAGKGLVITGITLLYLLSTNLVSNLLISPLESDYAPLKGPVADARAVVVLTSGIQDLSHLGLGVVSDSSSLRRLVYGIKIYKKNSGMKLIIVGGRADPVRPQVSFGRVLGDEALELGVSEDDLLIEEESKNTYEGALNLSDNFNDSEGRRVVIVTSAFHMPRSVKLYRKAGFDVIPAPTDFKGSRFIFGLNLFVPSAEGVGRSSVAIYEYISSSWYIIRELFT